MHIYCDESGSFATANTQGSWCVIASYVLAEQQRALARRVLLQHKLRAGATYRDEVKRSATTEAKYFIFLEELATVEGMAVAIATDSGFNHGAAENRDAQVTMITAALAGANDNRQYEIKKLQTEMSALSPQLYVEYGCRLHLAWRTIRLAALYFCNRYTATLGRFRWRMDDKPPRLKELYHCSIPGFIEQLGKDEPLELLDIGDYWALARFIVPSEVIAGTSRSPPPVQKRIYSAARMMTDDVAFVDSTTCDGVQIADLVVSGLYCCLRGGFEDNNRAAELLGRLLFSKANDQQVLPLVHFTAGQEPPVDNVAEAAIQLMGCHARRLEAR